MGDNIIDSHCPESFPDKGAMFEITDGFTDIRKDLQDLSNNNQLVKYVLDYHRTGVITWDKCMAFLVIELTKENERLRENILQLLQNSPQSYIHRKF